MIVITKNIVLRIYIFVCSDHIFNYRCYWFKHIYWADFVCIFFKSNL